jgi:hypothetical protein
MAAQPASDRKSQLIAELERSRAELDRSLRGVRYDLKVGPHLQHAFLRHKGVWLAGAALAGWLISRLPARKKAMPNNSGARHQNSANRPKEPERAGVVLAVLSVLGAVLKPAVTAFASKQIAELVKKNVPTAFARPQPRR